MKKRVIAIGFFDGVHKGHKALMDKACEIAKKIGATSAVLTFKIHPDIVVSNEPVYLIGPHREHDIKKYGKVDEVIFCDFDAIIAKMSWQDFVLDILIKKYNATHIITGKDFKFGYKGLGNSENLAKFLNERNIGYDFVEEIKIDNIRVSSTYIRKLIKSGDIETANKFLAHPFTVSGTVMHGRKVGRKLGFRTININAPKNLVTPLFGVYATKIKILDKEYLATTNVGVIPTFLDDNIVKIEAHLLDFDQDVYGEYVEIEFFKLLRTEKKFKDLDELKKTINENIKQTIKYFGG